MNLSDFKITEVREFEHRRGVAWEAEISLDGEVVILICQIYLNDSAVSGYPIKFHHLRFLTINVYSYTIGHNGQ